MEKMEWEEINIINSLIPRFGVRNIKKTLILKHINFISDGLFFIYGGFSKEQDNKEKLFYTPIPNSSIEEQRIYDTPFDTSTVDLDPSFLLSPGNYIHGSCFIEGSTLYLFGQLDTNTIQLVDQNLKTIPQNVLQFGNVKTLDLKHNKIISKTFPKKLNFAHLKILDLSQNQLTEYPIALNQLENLKELDLSQNKLEKLSNCSLKNLEIFHLKNCSMKKIQKWNIPRIKYIDLWKNSLTSIPDGIESIMNLNVTLNKINSMKGIEKCQKLKVLRISFNEFNEFPKEILELKQLEELYMKNCKVRNLDKNIDKLNKLNILVAIENEIKSLPDEMSNLTNLESLNVSFNAIEEIPPSFGKLINLSSLYIQSNSLTKLPEEMKYLKNLEIFSCSRNRISDIGPLMELSKLRVLYCENNQITEIPRDIQHLELLDRLYWFDISFI